MNYTAGGLSTRKIIHEEDRTINEVTITDMSLKKTNKYEAAMHLYSNRSQ